MIRTNEELLQLPVNKKQCIDSSTVLDFPYLSPNDISMFQTQWNSPIIDSSNTTTINHHSDDDAPASHQHVLLNMGGPGQVVTVIDKHSTTTNIAASASAFPFRHGIISNIFDPDIMMDVKRELLNEPFFHKSNDLYEFYQSEDLKKSSSPLLKQLLSTLYSSHFISLLSTLTGIQLVDRRIDVSGHRYPHGGFLLCHDDDIADWEDETTTMATSTSEVVGKEREEDGEAIIPSSPDHASPTSSSYSRRIAFIIYLVQPDWSLSDGGCLQLFESVSDATLGLYAQPGRIVKSLVPRFNSMAFFEVTPTSYHQVQEVLRRDDRVSISGWFHGPKPVVREAPHVAVIPHPFSPPLAKTNSSSSITSSSPTTTTIDGNVNNPLAEFLNPIYLKETAIEAISDRFADTSSIELVSFLKTDVYQGLMEEMESLDTRLAIKKERKKDNAITTDLLVSSTGPASRRWYQTIHPNAKQSSSSLAPLLPRLSALTLFLSSNAFREFLQRVTGLSLKTFTSSSSLEVRRFTVGSYTLLHDEDSGDHHQNEETKSFSGLDVQFHLIKKSTSTTTTKNEEDERTSDSSTAVVCGGETIYVADSETLLTLYPQENTLCLVLRDEGVMRFVRYLGVKSPLAMNNNNSNSGVRGQCDVAMAWQVEEDEDDEKKEEEV